MARYRVVLVEPEGPENIGYVARAMRNFGLSELVLVNPKTGVTALSLQRAMHGAGVLKRARVADTIGSACKGCAFVAGTTGKLANGYSVHRTVFTPAEFAKAAAGTKGRIALLFGRETIGLKNSELAKCDAVVSAQANARYPILNLHHAVAIVLYELFAARSRPVREAPSQREKEVLLRVFHDHLSALAYTEKKKEIMERAFRNLVGRAMISRRELFTLAGAFKHTKRRRGPDVKFK